MAQQVIKPKNSMDDFRGVRADNVASMPKGWELAKLEHFKELAGWTQEGQRLVRGDLVLMRFPNRNPKPEPEKAKTASDNGKKEVKASSEK